MYRYKVGQKVRITPDLSINHYASGHHVVKDMLQHSGKIVTIDALVEDYEDVYRIKEDYSFWGWAGAWFLPARISNEELV